MAKPPRKKRAPVTRGRKQAAQPAASRLILHFTHPEDPSAEQTDVVRILVKKFASKVRVAREMPGALQVDVLPETEAEFRREVQALPDWDVASEGTAEMPSSPLPEETESDEVS